MGEGRYNRDVRRRLSRPGGRGSPSQHRGRSDKTVPIETIRGENRGLLIIVHPGGIGRSPHPPSRPRGGRRWWTRSDGVRRRSHFSRGHAGNSQDASPGPILPSRDERRRYGRSGPRGEKGGGTQPHNRPVGILRLGGQRGRGGLEDRDGAPLAVVPFLLLGPDPNVIVGIWFVVVQEDDEEEGKGEILSPV